MKFIFPLITLINIILFNSSLHAQYAKEDSAMLSSFYKTALSDKKGYNFLHDLCKQAGPRISGSAVCDTAVQLSYRYLKTTGADTVYLQEVMVPHWVRGEKEQASIINKKEKTPVTICALGGSVGTGKAGITAEIIEVKSVDELKKLSRDKVEGKIVFFNGPMNEENINAFDSYGPCVEQRWGGAMAAASLGAVASLVRSVTMSLDKFPHTGSVAYADTIKKIPAVAIATLDADLLSKQLSKNKSISFYIRTTSEMLPDVKSYNVIAELRGSEKPNEYIIIGGHLDAWDMAEGAHDDGAGVTHSCEVIRLMKQCGYQPKHTIRVVFFMNEENGLRGAKKYAEWVKETQQKHLFALESDAGGFVPRGFSFDTSDKNLAFLLSWKPLFELFECGALIKGGSGADVGRLKGNCEVLCGLNPDSQRYFDHHHAANDVFEEVHPRELELGAAACTSLLYMFDKYW